MKNMAQKSKPQWHQPLARVMDIVLNGNVKFKHAAEVGRRAVVYCRGDDLLKWVEDNKEMLNEKHFDALDRKKIESTDDAVDVCNKLIRFGFLYRAQYKPIDDVVEKDEDGNFRRPKWPKRLAATAKQNFDARYFYCCAYEGSKRWQYIMLLGVIAVVLCVCMFPAWPLKLKIGLWYMSVFFLTFILILVVVRLVLFLILWFVGFQFWFLPNLFNEDAGFVDSFLPLYELERCVNDKTMWLTRAFCAILAAATIYKLGETHSPHDVAIFARQSLLDVLEWGTLRLSAPYNERKSLPGIEEGIQDAIDDKESPDSEPQLSTVASGDDEDYSCLKTCGYATFDDLMISKCLVKCECMQEIVESKCYNKICANAARASLEEARADACREEERRKEKRKQKNF